MTCEIIEYHPTPIPQNNDEAIYYERRKPADSELNMNYSLQYVYDFIRMLSDPYPNAFISFKDKSILFKDAKLKDDVISGRYEIR